MVGVILAAGPQPELDLNQLRYRPVWQRGRQVPRRTRSYLRLTTQTMVSRPPAGVCATAHEAGGGGSLEKPSERPRPACVAPLLICVKPRGALHAKLSYLQPHCAPSAFKTADERRIAIFITIAIAIAAQSVALRCDRSAQPSVPVHQC